MSMLWTCATSGNAPFYTPGHKKGSGVVPQLLEQWGKSVFWADLPELPELDNLFAPEGVIQAAQALAADAFGGDLTWFLCNGSTGGIMAALLAVCHPGDQVILPRNVHRSVISGLILADAQPVFMQPEYDPAWDLAHGVTPGSVAAALHHHPDAKAVLIVSPTYDGACCDVAAIAQVVHRQGLPLIVDEAHGAHFAFHPQLPTPALACGADVVVQSIHKTLSALTQAAMLHLQGDLVEADRMTRALALVQSSSPSYLLLASLDAARYQMATQGHYLMQHTLDLAQQARSRLMALAHIDLLQPAHACTPGFVALDPTRLTVNLVRLGIDGFTADECLNQHLGITAELPLLRQLIFILSLGNQAADVDRLVQGFEQLPTFIPTLPKASAAQGKLVMLDSLASWELPTVALAPRAAFFAPAETVEIQQAVGRPCAELVCPYPPGIPLLIPGEVVTQAAISMLQAIIAAGGVMTGCADPRLEFLRVVQSG
jgi:arginine decarboxylase